jgi:anti-sigma B factor antagonist
VRSLARFSVAIEQLGEACLIRVIGDLDLSTADRLGSALDAARADGVTTLVDLSAVNFIDSAGLRVLLRSAQAIDARRWDWRIVRASSAVWRLAEVSGTTSALPLGAPVRNAAQGLTAQWASH